MDNITDRIKKASDIEPKTILQRYLKLGEECGELAQEIGINEKISGFTYKKPGKDGINGECVDVTIMALSIFFKNGGTVEELKEIFHKKIYKWEENVDVPF